MHVGDSREFISLGALDDAIENEDVTVSLRSKDQDILLHQPGSNVKRAREAHLIQGLLMVEDLLDPADR